MAENLNLPSEDKKSKRKNKRKSKLIFRLLLPMLFLVLFQLATFFSVLIAGGEFTYIRQYAYNTLIEKTENRKNYIENEFQLKIPAVNETAEKVNSIVDKVLKKDGLDISDIKTNKQLNKDIVESSVDSLVNLLRRSMANDVYIMLETGSLYDDEGGKTNSKAALYLRDLDTKTDAGYSDLLMETGFSSISQNLGIILDSGWTLHFESDPSDTKNYDYYYRTIQNAEQNPDLSLNDLGYWSDFSQVTKSASDSMKYTVPLIFDDGTVYGVLGIGLTENNILEHLPVNDFLSETACYVLGKSPAGSDYFDIIMHSGISFNRLVENETTLKSAEKIEEGVYSFDLKSNISSAGSIQYINLYNDNSPYSDEKWALISVADRASVLKPMDFLVNILIMSAIISIVGSFIVIILSSRKIVAPISSAIKIMNSSREYSEVIKFEPSNIYELDKMTDAITQLQINVQNFSSQVSKMIRMSDIGIGTFMYDSLDDSVFVGQSLLKLLNFPIQPNEDVVMSRQSFLDNIIAEETRQVIADSIEKIPVDSQTDYVREYSINQEDGTTVWMKLSLVHNNNKSIGILQDVTSTVMEKKRIEYERDYDSITGLLNRHAYYRELESLFRDPEKLGVTAFIMLDLDNLKYVNDTYGHDFGDDYIKTAATTLKAFQNYGGIVSRLSGDEFNICLWGFASKDDVRKVINEVREKMAHTYCLLADGTHFKIRASGGIAWYPDNSESYEMLMKYADFAMYTIKHSTKGEMAEFDMSAYAKDSVLINGVEEMNRIIDECSIRYAFHSIVSVKTGDIFGYEALMRPQSTVLQSPLELLRIAKTGAKLYEIERLTWTKALSDFKKQIDEGRIPHDAHIFINSISNCILEQSDIDIVESLYPELLQNVVLEILESENVNEDYSKLKLERVKKWNALTALDDFGTGYNSEYALITMNPNIIKIDRSIISGCDKDISRRTIISNLVKLVKPKNILVLAEGVETESELKTVIKCGVDLLQGYYINRPVFEPTPIPKEVSDTIRRFVQESHIK